MFTARARALWERPNFGLHATCAGILLLAGGLVLNRIMPSTFSYDPDDWVVPTVLWGYIALRWLMYLAGGALICVGTWRIFMIDTR